MGLLTAFGGGELAPSRLSGLAVPAFGQAAFDAFTDVDGTAIPAHVASDGGSWTKHATASSAGDGAITGNRSHNDNAASTHLYYHSWAAASADYAVECGVVMRSDNNLSISGPAGRIDPASVTAYHLRYNTGTNGWQLFKFVAGASTQLGGDVAQTLVVDQEYRATLRMVGQDIVGLVDGVLIIAVTDASIPAPGRAGLRFNGAATGTTGVHLDNFRVWG